MRTDQNRTVGLITYNSPHLKTEQIIENMVENYQSMKMYALPFVPRKDRGVLFHHRPNQVISIAPEVIAEKHNIDFIKCENDLNIDGGCDIYLVLGAGILSEKCVENKKIINAHPGIIPACRGLDSFKWAIYNDISLGNTLHYIDKNVDSGEIISVIPTTVYKTDSLETLCRRHYENEIKMLSNFESYLKTPVNNYSDIQSGEPTMRMSAEIEAKMVRMLDGYVQKWGQ
ncbi:MAG: formyltransferase family protein [Candidatus Endonucleobacter bathymodioli]|uniref:phosphoribosylglycinamide formyltransferase 1 n=1 Tax=Candidatus Endonucleibacter bathymodioli TaxID=539814 RepID=A0AA90NVI9_9GAMM|nr:formyltransferase family protein [Candidatus Endonucleobacter bathymodioli]